MSLIVDPTSVSFSKIVEDLEAFLENAPDASRWQGFFESQVGQRVVELVAAVGALFTYNTTVGRRENYLRFVTQRSNALGISENLGYSAFRGSNVHQTLTVTPNTTTVLPKFTVVGSIVDKDIVLLEAVTLNAGTQTTIEVGYGLFKNESITIDTDSISIFRFLSPDVSEDFRVLLNGTELDTSERILDLINDKYATLTNVFDSVDVMSLNQPTNPNPYIVGDTLTLEFIELAEFFFQFSDINFNFGTVDSAVTSKEFLSKETIDEIRVNAPVFHETQNLIRGREDYRKIFLGLDTSIISTNGRDVSPAVIELVYVKEDLELFTDSEKQAFIEQLEENRMYGVQPPIMTDPVRCLPTFEATITRIPLVAGDAETEIGAIFDNFEKKLLEDEKTIDFLDVERQIEELAFVQTARLKVSSSDWQAVTGYERCQHVNPTTPNGLVFEMSRRCYKTGDVEPTWPTTVGERIEDGGIVWETQVTDVCQNLVTWTSLTEKFREDIVVPTVPNGYMYVAVANVNLSFGNNEVQRIEFDSIPDSGTWRIHFGTEKTSNLAFNASALDVENALNALDSLSEVVVTGDYATGFTLTFQGADGNKGQPEVEIVDPGTDEVQKIEFDQVPNNGSWALEFDSQTTAVLPFNATNTDVKNALEALSNIDLVDVVGDATNGFDITFQGVNAKTDVPLLVQTLVADPGQDEIQTIEFSSVPASGTWRIHFGSEFTSDLAFDATTTTIQTELNSLEGLSTVSVTGDYASGIDIEFTGNDGLRPQPLVDVNNVGQNAQQTIQFSTIPDSGTFKLEHEGNFTAPILSNATTTDIASALNALPSLSTVTVSGDYAQGLTVDFVGADGLQPQALLGIGVDGVNEIRNLSFSAIPDSGSFRLIYDSQTTGQIPFNATALDVKAALEALPNLDEVGVTGSTAIGFDIEFLGSLSETNVVPILINNNTLMAGLSNVTITASTPIQGAPGDNSLRRLGVKVELTVTETQPGLIQGNSLGGGVTITSTETQTGQSPTSQLDRNGDPVVITISETTTGDVPANNLLSGVSPVVVTPSTVVDAITAEPTWPNEIGATVVDGDIVWQMVPLNGTPDTWEPGKNYFPSEYAQPSSPVTDVDSVVLMAQVVGFVGTSGPTEPVFPLTTGVEVPDNNIIWIGRDPNNSPEPLAFNEYYLIDQTVVDVS